MRSPKEIILDFLPIRDGDCLHTIVSHLLNVIKASFKGVFDVKPEGAEVVMFSAVCGHPCCGMCQGQLDSLLEVQLMIFVLDQLVLSEGCSQQLDRVDSALVLGHAQNNRLVNQTNDSKQRCIYIRIQRNPSLSHSLSGVKLIEDEDGNNISMRGHQTYTLTSILNANEIRPQVYQQILHDIKSPLEQVSVDLTHDNSLEIEVPRRPNIPPAPPKSPLAKLRDINFSRTHESVSLSLGQTPKKETFHDEVMESVLSPLDQQVSFKEEPSGLALFCGGLMDSILKADNRFEVEVQLPTRTKPYRRRPIFEGSRLTRRIRSVQEVVGILGDMGELRLAVFFQLLGELEVELGRVRQERQELRKDMGTIYDKYSGSIEFLRDDNEDSLLTYRIHRRLHSKNTCELVTKILKEKSPARTIETERRLQALLESLGRLESTISNFMSRDDAIEVLETVHATLQDHYPSEPSLLGQLNHLCSSFGCQPNLESIELIWREGERRKVSRSQFVEGISMNDCIVRLPKSFEEELKMKGFKRNQ